MNKYLVTNYSTKRQHAHLFSVIIRSIPQCIQYTVMKLLFLVCSNTLDVDANLPQNVKDMVTCQLPRGCYGVQCCLNLTFTLPLGDTVTSKNFSFWFIMDPCDFTIDIGLGGLTLLKSTFLQYDFGINSFFDR